MLLRLVSFVTVGMVLVGLVQRAAAENTLVLPPPDADYRYLANSTDVTVTGGNVTAWNNSGTAGGQNWGSFNTGTEHATLENVTSATYSFTQAVQFNGNGQPNNVGGGETGSFNVFGTNTGSFEFWLRPDAISTGGEPQTIFDSGGGNGIGLNYQDGTLTWQALPGTPHNVSHTLSDVSDFTHVVVVMDPNGAGAGQAQTSLFIDGNTTPVDIDTDPTTLPNWIAGGDGSGLGGRGGSNTGGFGGGSAGGHLGFDGQIAAVQFYVGTVLSSEDVANLYNAFVVPPPPLTPEPSSFALFGMIVAAAMGTTYWRRRRDSVAA